MSHVVLRGRWRNMFLNVHAQTWEKSDDSRDSFYEELDQVFLSFDLLPYKISIRRFLCESGDS
jgi:hypothetical protein